MQKLLLIVLFSLIYLNCSSNKPDVTIDLESRFIQGKAFLEDEKYLRAQEEFQYVVIRGTGSDLGDDAQFYLGESFFLNKEYLLAISEFEKLARKMAFSPYVEKARYRICEAYDIESPEYYLDQTYSQKALERYQEFIEDFPSSPKVSEALTAIQELRNKMAFKILETGVLYIKMEEYESAILAYEQLTAHFYDTSYAEEAHLGIIKSHCLLKNVESAESYLDNNNQKIKSNNTREKAHKYINNAKKLSEKESN